MTTVISVPPVISLGIGMPSVFLRNHQTYSSAPFQKLLYSPNTKSEPGAIATGPGLNLRVSSCLLVRVIWWLKYLA